MSKPLLYIHHGTGVNYPEYSMLVEVNREFSSIFMTFTSFIKSQIYWFSKKGRNVLQIMIKNSVFSKTRFLLKYPTVSSFRIYFLKCFIHIFKQVCEFLSFVLHLKNKLCFKINHKAMDFSIYLTIKK